MVLQRLSIPGALDIYLITALIKRISFSKILFGVFGSLFGPSGDVTILLNFVTSFVGSSASPQTVTASVELISRQTCIMFVTCEWSKFVRMFRLGCAVSSRQVCEWPPWR